MNHEVDLSQFDAAFAAAEVPSGEFEEVPDGKYQVRIEKVKLTTTKKTGTPMLRWQFKVLGPKFEGRRVFHSHLIKTEANVTWLKKDLQTCGLKLEKLSELPAHMGELLDVALEVTVRTNDGYTNAFFDKRLELGTDDIAEDDVPF